MRLIGPSTILDPTDDNYMTVGLVERFEVGDWDFNMQAANGILKAKRQCVNVDSTHRRSTAEGQAE